MHSAKLAAHQSWTANRWWRLISIAIVTMMVMSSAPAYSVNAGAASNLVANITQSPVLNPEPSGPDHFPAGVNPLTGLEVKDPVSLELPPVLVSITNFPVSARPQAGLSFSPYVFEMYIGMGMTRYLALFYGDYPRLDKEAGSEEATQEVSIGPIRSGRLPYEKLRNFYNGSLVMSGASSQVGAQLNLSTTVFGSDEDDINSAMLDVTRLQKIAEANALHQTKAPNLTANRFDLAVPEGGKAAESAQVFYNFYNQIQWSYDQASGGYLRSQDKADGSGKFYPAADRLNGERLAFENVVVLFAEHRAVSPTIIDLDLGYRTGPALLFRDGKVYNIAWSTVNGEYEKSTMRLRPIRFLDAEGQPFPMKPGQTWVEFVTPASTAREFAPGNWKIRFYAP